MNADLTSNLVAALVALALVAYLLAGFRVEAHDE